MNTNWSKAIWIAGCVVMAASVSMADDPTSKGGQGRSRGDSSQGQSRSGRSNSDQGRSRGDSSPSRGGGSQESRPSRGDSGPRPSEQRGGGQSSGRFDPPPVNRGGGSQESRPSRGDSGPRPSEQRGGGQGSGRFDPPPVNRGGGQSQEGRPSRGDSGPKPAEQRGNPSRGDSGPKPAEQRGGGQGSGRFDPPPVYRGGGQSQGNSGRPSRGDTGPKPAEQRGGNDGLGRFDPPQRGSRGPTGQPIPAGRLGGSGDLTDKGRPQRGGGNDGGSSNNGFGRHDRPTEIGPAPIFNRGSLGGVVLRDDNVRITYRNGYCQYNNYWHDNWFAYPFYCYSFTSRCVISPWYYYVNLPAYVNCNRIIYVDNPFDCWWQGDAYRYRGYRSYDRFDQYDRSDLDQSLDDLVRAFQDADRGALDRLVPTSGKVGIYTDSHYDYSLSADDFYDLMVDNIEGTRTQQYMIYSVTTRRNEAQVSARHEFIDPWGRGQVVYHHYRLERRRHDYVITDFMTSNRRTGY